MEILQELERHAGTEVEAWEKEENPLAPEREDAIDIVLQMITSTSSFCLLLFCGILVCLMKKCIWGEKEE